MALALVLVPLGFAALAAAVPSQRFRPWLLPVCGAIHGALTLAALGTADVAAVSGWLRLDHLGRLVLAVVSVLFFACSLYAPGYLALRTGRSNRVFVPCLLFFLAMTTLVVESQHLGLMWVAIEATTLATAPLLHFNHNARSIEATWKYLLIGGTGLALALLGSFCLGYASLHAGGGGDLTFSALVARGPALSRSWVLVAWVLLLTGYGTKMGLAPMHTWKPDAYGEAPSIIGAMLAGGMTTVAFVAVLRVRQVVDAAGAGAMANRSLMALGLFSTLVAALFLLATRDFKRMLAYSSVEHMGILTIGASLGAPGVWAALFHVWTNGLTKGALFLSAGNIRRARGGRTMDEVAGVALLTPVSAGMFVIGMLAVTAFPPFGPFFSELRIVRAGLASGQGLAIAGLLGCLLFAFFGLSRLVFAIVDGRPRAGAQVPREGFHERVAILLAPLFLLGCSLWLGVATPQPLREAWTAAATALFPTP